MVLGSGFFLAFLIIGFIAWWYLPSAAVTIYISPKRLEEEETIFIDPDVSSPNFASATLPGDVVTTSVEGERTKSTTGTKTVGEKARGTVKIQNGTAQNIKLAVDTILVSSGDLEFALTETASVSAALSPSSPGTATVEVVAVDIGSEYNLAKDESFVVGNYPKAEVDAVATADFSGGSSRQISAVSAEDQSQLEDDLTEELLDEAKADLAEKVSENQSFIEESVSATPSSESFNHKVGDEADNLKLSLSLDVLGIVTDKQSLFDWAKEVLKDEVPEGYVLREDQIDMQFELKGEKNGVYELAVAMDVNLLPEIKPDEIAEKIAGRYAPLAEDYLMSISGFTRAEINLKPPLPGRLGTLPHVAKKIEVELAAER
ncbi:MAG: baseplate J/gp47 family protein [Patescibacteria group bacterium]